MTLRGGTLDRTIAIQRVTETQSGSGEVHQSWVTLSIRPASVEYLRSDERLQSEQLLAKTQAAFTIRFSDAIADLSALDRIIYPASALTASPPTLKNAIFDIFSVEEVTYREKLRVLASQRPESA